MLGLIADIWGKLSAIGNIFSAVKVIIQGLLARALYVAGENKQANRDLQATVRGDQEAKVIDAQVDGMSREQLIAAERLRQQSPRHS